MLIGELSKISGLSRDSIRFYERIGLIRVTAGNRRANNYKDYPVSVVERIETIRQLKTFGFTLAEAAELLALIDAGQNPCDGLPENMTAKIASIDEKIAQLQSIRSRLEQARAACGGADCAGLTVVQGCLSCG